MRTPLLLQMEAVECGAAALGIVLAHYKRIVPLPVLRQDCGVSRDGSKASNILKAARRYGLVAKGFKKSLQTVQSVRFPAIVFWNFNHFVVLEGFKGDRVYINDPASGRRTVSFQEFDQCYTGVVLVLEPGPEFEEGGEFPSVLGALRRNLHGSYTALLYCVLVGFCLVVPGLAFPVLTQLFIDFVIIQGHPDWVTPLLIGMGITILIEGLLRFLQLRHLRDLRVKLSVGMSSKFLWHVLHLPIGYFAQRFSGEISDRVGLNDSVASLLSGRLARTAIDCVLPFFYAMLMFWYDPFLTLVGIAGVLLNVLCLRVVSRARRAANMRALQEGGKLSGVAIAGLQSMETLKASAQESSFFSRWSGYYAKTINARQSMALADQVLSIVPGLLASFSNLLVLVMGGVRVMEGAMTIGMLIAFQILLRQFQAPVDTLVDMASSLQTLGGDLGRLDDVLRHPVDPQAKSNLEVSDHGEASLEGFVELQNVTFGYSPIAPPLIVDFSLRLEPGQRVALVGGSGSGKSTIARLITGLFQPRSGQILLDACRLQQIPRRVLANSLAMVEQEVFFFAGTVRDNLTLWDPTIPDAVLEQACRDAAIHDVINSMPGSYQAELLEGASNLSGGQQQRLEIARALVHTPSILVLDEATSALDAETERLIDRNLRMRGCTCIVIAHRLSTIRDCDEIIVLRSGEVMQRGTYDELRADDKGEFANLLRETGQA